MKKLPRNLEMSTEVCNFAPAKCNGSGFSAVGSAHVWGARGRWFESSNPDQNNSVAAETMKVSAVFILQKI